MAPTRSTYESNTDTCRYSIDFPPPDDSGDRLEAVCAHVLAYADKLSQGYIWHKQHSGISLDLSPASPAAAASAATVHHRHLQGSTNVTDAVDDEWLVVWILRQISRNWHTAVIDVSDDDGEFLLIEAADHLPAWLTPQNAANRVWIHQGRLHLVPLEHKSPLPFAAARGQAPSADETLLNPSFDPDDDSFLDRAAAIHLVRDDKVDTLAPKEVEEAVWARIDGYPAKMKEHHHRTLAYLPTEVAFALADSPSLVAEAVGAFYEREPATLRAVNTMSRFPPSPPLPSPSSSSSSSASSASTPSPLPGTVLVPTLLTRPLYSQLVLQRFYAPKPFDKAGWTVGALGPEDERRRSVGMKIACGFEMLYKQTLPLPRQSSGDLDADLDAVDTSTPAYGTYLAALRDAGWFGDEVEGSEGWKVRERDARRGWVRAREGDRPTRSFAQRVDEAILRARSSASPPLPQRVPDPAALSPAAAHALEDPEDWMALDEQGLEDLLASRAGAGTRSTAKGGGQLGDSDLEDEDEEDDEEDGEDEDEGGRGQGMEGVERDKGARESAEDRKARRVAQRLEEMAGKVEQFVEGRGAASGALFDDERDLDGSDDSDEDEDEAMPELSAEERASRMEKLVAALPAEQWGQKTAPPPVAASSAAAAPAGDPSAAIETPGPLPRAPRSPKLAKEVYEGASDLSDASDSDDDEPMPGGEACDGGEDLDGEDGPSVVNEEDVLDLGEEMDEFLKFATETLGLTEAQYEKILADRRGRGAFVPGPAKEKRTNVLPSAKTKASSSSSSSGAAAAAAPPKPSPAAATAAGNPPPPREPLRNPNLTDFDALMEQMESELARAKGGRAGPAPAPAPSGAGEDASGKDDDDGPAPTGKYASRQSRNPHSDRIVVDSLSDSDDDDGEGDMAAMDAELASLLQGVAGAAGAGAGGTDTAMDYNLVKNFLDSFQSQGGFAGPAGTLAGRLGFPLPRDAGGDEEEGRR